MNVFSKTPNRFKDGDKTARMNITTFMMFFWINRWIIKTQYIDESNKHDKDFVMAIAIQVNSRIIFIRCNVNLYIQE